MTANHPIPILQFSNSTVRGGVEEHILTLLRGLDRRYFELHLVATPEVISMLSADLPGDVRVYPLRLDSPTQLGAAWRLARILRQRHIQILHSHMFQASLFASPIGWLCRVPVIVETPHVREQWRKGWIKRHYAIDRVAGHFVSRYVAVSEANARYLVEEKGIAASKVEVIRNGIDLGRFVPARLEACELRKTTAFSECDFLIVVVGRLEPQKGHAVLLQALVNVAREFPRLRAAFVGEGSLRARLQESARALGLENVVCFAGHQPHPENWLAMADVVVLPSFYEGLPIAAIESLAMGKPLVATAVDGTPEVVAHERTGLTVPPGNSAALAASICRLLRDPKLRRELGKAGRQWVLARFNQEQQVSTTQALYLAALSSLGIQSPVPAPEFALPRNFLSSRKA